MTYTPRAFIKGETVLVAETREEEFILRFRGFEPATDDQVAAYGFDVDQSMAGAEAGYTPQAFVKDNRTVTSTSREDEFRLMWLGYVPLAFLSRPPAPRTEIPAYLADLDTLRQDLATSGSLSVYTHTQVTPAATWTITHNLNRKRMPVLLPDDSTQPVFTDVFFLDFNTVVVEWPEPTSGTAHF